MNADPQDIDLAAVSAARMERRFRKRPIEVTAIQWTGENESELAGWTGRRFAEIDPQDRTEDPEITGHVFDELHKTWVGVKTGQWVIRGVAGEFYPIDESVLAETYEPVAPVPESVKRPPEEWCEAYGLLVLDPDGWRVPGAPAWTDPVALADFYHRALESTTNGLVTGAFTRIRADLDAQVAS